MASYTQEIGTFDFLGLINKSCTVHVRCDAVTNIKNNLTELRFYLLREGNPVYEDYIKYEITVNGEKKNNTDTDVTGKETYLRTITVNHDEDGYLGKVDIEFELHANYSELLFTWFFHESCSLSFFSEDIDRSTPEVYLKSTSADRFGKNASITFSFDQWDGLSLSSLAATEAKLTLKGLERHQATNRTALSLNADSVSTTIAETVDGVDKYTLTASKTSGLRQNEFITFTLDSADSQDIAPLTSGKAYEYEIAVTSENGNTGILTGSLQIPQRVTAFSCEERIDIIVGQEENLDCSVYPSNSQIQSLNFVSSDKEIAVVNEQGIITPVEEGFCKITVTPDDNGVEPFLCNEYTGGYFFGTTWYDLPNIYSKSTGLIKVSPTDRFVYTGNGNDEIPSLFWFSDKKVYWSNAAYSGTVEVSPPLHAGYVRFQSFGYNKDDTELHVERHIYGEPFKGECIVAVSSEQGFPQLPENVQFLTDKLFNKINVAANFVRDELTEQGATVELFSDSAISGKNHPVLQIKEKLISTENNCQRLKAAAIEQGYNIETLPSSQVFQKANNGWSVIVNNWILFLNDLHNKINGG